MIKVIKRYAKFQTDFPRTETAGFKYHSVKIKKLTNTLCQANLQGLLEIIAF